MARSPEPELEGAPHFDFKMRHMMIDGSYSIIPTKPIEVGNERQFLMDDHLVDSSWNCFRRVHQPQKHQANPLIPGGEITPDGYKTPANWGTVVYDEELQRFRFWATAWNLTRPKWDMSYAIGYWESRDGIEWTAPELGLIDYEGSTANNLIMAEKGRGYGSPSVIEVPERLRARGRYAMLHGGNRETIPPGRTHVMEDNVSWSEDGIRWEPQPENPVFVGRNDTFVNMVYNPERDVFMQYRRASVNAHEIRRFAYTESADLVSWTQPEVIFDADELDAPMIYDFTANRYHGMYVGFLHPLYGVNAGYTKGPRLYRDGHVRKEHHTDVELAWSRDGKKWERHPERPIFIENGTTDPASKYDWGLIYVCQGIVERGDVLYIYYRGDSALHINMPGVIGNFCLATLRKDGFVSRGTLGYSDWPGYMLTRPLSCPGGRLRINARTAPGGSIRVAVRSGDGGQDGEYLEVWNFEDMSGFTGDSTDFALEWNGKPTFDSLKGESVRLHFWFDNAELYSFRFE